MKILWPETAVWVQVPLAVLRKKKESTCKFTCEVFSFWLLQVARWTYVESPTRGTVSGRTGKIGWSACSFVIQRITTQDVGWLSAVRVRSSRTSPAQRVCCRGSLRDAPCRSPRRVPHLHGKCVLYRLGRR